MCKNHHAWFGGMQPACLLPVSHFQTRMRSSTDGLGHTVQSQPGSSLVLVKWIQSGSKLVCKNHHAWFGGMQPACLLPVSHFQTRMRSSTDGLGHTVQNQPGSSLVLATCIWSGSKLVCKNHQARFWQNATSPLPVFHLQTQWRSSTDGLGHIVQSQPGSNLVPPGPIWFRLNPVWFRLTASSFGQMDPVWKQAGVQESPVNTSSNQCFQADLDQM